MAKGPEGRYLGVLAHLTLDPGSVHSVLLDKLICPVGHLPSMNKMEVYRYALPTVGVSRRGE